MLRKRRGWILGTSLSHTSLHKYQATMSYEYESTKENVGPHLYTIQLRWNFSLWGEQSISTNARGSNDEQYYLANCLMSRYVSEEMTSVSSIIIHISDRWKYTLTVHSLISVRIPAPRYIVARFHRTCSRAWYDKKMHKSCNENSVIHLLLSQQTPKRWISPIVTPAIFVYTFS